MLVGHFWRSVMPNELICTVCGRGPFKSRSGMLGHAQWKHEGRVVPMPGYRRQNGAEMVPMDAPVGQLPVTRQDLEDLQEYLTQAVTDSLTPTDKNPFPS